MPVYILLTSDLHTDVGDFGKTVARTLPALAAEMRPDIFIIAGDVSPEISKFKNGLQGFTETLSCPKLFVPGNHDIWVARSNKSIDSWIKYDDLLPSACQESGFHFLPGRPIEICGIAFAGTIGWYDYSFRNREMDDRITLKDYQRKRFHGRVWNDKYYARWNKPDEEVAQEFARRLDEDLSSLDSLDIPIVCVTHHLPFPQLVQHTGDADWDYFSAFMGSASIGETILRHKNAKYALSGHTHRRTEAHVNGVLAMTSPIGYEHEVRGEPMEHLRNALRLIEILVPDAARDP